MARTPKKRIKRSNKDVVVELLPHQLEFVQHTDSKYLALIGGYGCGKTYAFCVKAINLAQLNPNTNALLAEPTNAMVRMILVPAFEEALDRLNIEYELTTTPFPEFTLYFNEGPVKILCVSAENYTRIVGYEASFIGIDEADTIDHEVAHAMWKKFIGRLRGKGKVKQLFIATTPEGFKFAYDTFGTDKAKQDERKHMIKAKTTDNPNIDPEYIEDMLKDYTPEEARAYIDGEFVNLRSGQVYTGFDRELNDCGVTIDTYPGAVLHIGLDFNINHMSAVVHVIMDGKVYAVEEITNLRDTAQMIDVILNKYEGRVVSIYPDSSGTQERSNASESDIAQLKQHFPRVLFHKKNPRIYDRVTAMNQMFCNSRDLRRYYVNVSKCPTYTENLEKQAYKNGLPEKRNDVDHLIDAAGYFISFKYPVKGKPKVRIQ